jgi:hypothetical protein
MDKDELIRLYHQYPRLMYREVADRMGVTLGLLVNTLHFLQGMDEIVPRRSAPLLLTAEGDERLKLIGRMRANNASWNEVGAVLGIAPKSARIYLQTHRALLDDEQQRFRLPMTTWTRQHRGRLLVIPWTEQQRIRLPMAT